MAHILLYILIHTIKSHFVSWTLKFCIHCVLSDKLNNPHTSGKSYWSIPKILYNGKKIQLIPPILINSKLMSNVKGKANHLNAFILSQCTPVSNNSTLPLVTTPVTNASLSSISFNNEDVLKIIHCLNIIKHVNMMIYL